MKMLKYKIMVVNGLGEEVLYTNYSEWSEEEENRVKDMACNGEYEIVEFENDSLMPVSSPSSFDKLEEQYTAMMTDTLPQEG